jgi:hypothetical protein
MFVATNLNDFWIGIIGLSKLEQLVFCENLFSDAPIIMENCKSIIKYGLFTKHYRKSLKFEDFTVGS